MNGSTHPTTFWPDYINTRQTPTLSTVELLLKLWRSNWGIEKNITNVKIDPSWKVKFIWYFLLFMLKLKNASFIIYWCCLDCLWIILDMLWYSNLSPEAVLYPNTYYILYKRKYFWKLVNTPRSPLHLIILIIICIRT